MCMQVCVCLCVCVCAHVRARVCVCVCVCVLCLLLYPGYALDCWMCLSNGLYFPEQLLYTVKDPVLPFLSADEKIL